MDSEDKWIVLFSVIFGLIGGLILGSIAVFISKTPYSVFFMMTIVCSFIGFLHGLYMTRLTRIENPLLRFLLGGWFALVWGKNKSRKLSK